MPDSYDPVGAVVEAVAEYEQVQPGDLPSLADAVDSATFTELTTAWEAQTDDIEFTYVWYDVTVAPSGEVTVTP